MRKKIKEYMENVEYLIGQELEKKVRVEHLEFYVTDIPYEYEIREYLLLHPSFPYQKWLLDRIAREINISPGKYGEKN